MTTLAAMFMINFHQFEKNNLDLKNVTSSNI